MTLFSDSGAKLEKVLILILAIGVAIFIALPFFKNRFEKTPDDGESDTLKDSLEEKLKRLNSEKESLYVAIKEIDFDYDLGKLSKDDYDELQKKYKTQAASVLKRIDDIKRKAGALDLEGKIEKEIKAVRESKLTGDEEIEKQILKARKFKN